MSASNFSSSRNIEICPLLAAIISGDLEGMKQQQAGMNATEVKEIERNVTQRNIAQVNSKKHMDYWTFRAFSSRHCWPLLLVRNINVGTFLQQKLCHFHVILSYCHSQGCEGFLKITIKETSGKSITCNVFLIMCIIFQLYRMTGKKFGHSLNQSAASCINKTDALLSLSQERNKRNWWCILTQLDRRGKKSPYFGRWYRPHAPAAAQRWRWTGCLLPGAELCCRWRPPGWG